jgi:membrane protease YdiL (CAAX protease family)
MSFGHILKTLNLSINYAGILVGIIFLQQLTLLPLSLTNNVNTFGTKFFLTSISWVIQFLLALILWKKLFKTSGYNGLGRTNSLTKIIPVLCGVLIAMALIQMGTTYFQKNGIITSAENQLAVLKLYKNNPLGLIAQTIIFAPILEELIFRGMFLFGWSNTFGSNKLSLGLEIFVSAAIFALLHTSALSMSLVPYFLVGVILGNAYVKTRAIEVPIIGHMFLNLLAFIL